MKLDTKMEKRKLKLEELGRDAFEAMLLEACTPVKGQKQYVIWPHSDEGESSEGGDYGRLGHTG